MKIYRSVLWGIFGILLFYGTAFSRGDLDLPPLPEPEVYGDVLIDRVSTQNQVSQVVFSHWVHRAKYTCRVCHDQMEFSMKAGETMIVCNKGEMKGKYCGACHDGKISFAAKGEDEERCKRCHNASLSPNRDKFFELQKGLPKSRYGNGIDWVKAMDAGLIKPKDSLLEDSKPRSIHIGRTIELTAEMSGISSAVFPHKTHEQWLECSNCHPELFNIKKKTTRSMTMENMIKGESCALCHLRVAFPLNDCKRCHPGMKGGK